VLVEYLSRNPYCHSWEKFPICKS